MFLPALFIRIRHNGPVIGQSGFLDYTGVFFLEPFGLIQVKLFPVFRLLYGIFKCDLCRVTSVLVLVAAAKKHVSLASGSPKRAVLLLAFAADVVGFLVCFNGLLNIGLGLGLHEKRTYIGIPFLNKHIIPFGQGLISTERITVFLIQFVNLSLLLFLCSGKILYLTQRIVQFGTGTDGNRMSLFLDLVLFLHGFGKGINSVLGTEQALRPVYDFVAIHDQQHDTRRQRRLP